MDGTESHLMVALVIIGATGMMIIIRLWLHAVVSNRRMYRMMLTCGIDENTARNPDKLLDIDMKAARRHCRRCPAPKTCDRWLKGEAVPGNDFCPNADRFIAAANTGQWRVTYDPARRPGRRLDN
jgi:hypothetical protein